MMKVRVVIEGTAYDVEIVDLSARPVIAIVEGERFEVWPEASPVLAIGSLDGGRLPPSVPPPAPVTSTPTPASMPARSGSPESGAVLAPIPGIIVAVKVQPGDRVTAGQEVCVLEAMKMQNSIRAKQSGVVAMVHVKAGDQVKHHQALLVITPD
ncbi:biotin/lipoyl-containing protein [Roseiflexus sp. RS-1]|jgi:biotin carboxyl carrier protein|uniref:biotin/lipoyl-containing protein n=1 Tax=Roseiflexus sp. (strain RS-1) TaxID=357808 RepID=UPI0000D80EAB|nr:acetyl-CoA carboxylase biotin carboxyl carrier protein subunit [Roseiflexus sp. RS-1]ABQ92048.1 biotin/lipoyl attachment domain-containing protein [Roseiflexus sp. RS-1]